MFGLIVNYGKLFTVLLLSTIAFYLQVIFYLQLRKLTGLIRDHFPRTQHAVINDQNRNKIPVEILDTRQAMDAFFIGNEGDNSLVCCTSLTPDNVQDKRR